ncbi:hypothetical protein ASPBRDRAFT_655064 [Aspergillus brasiliensis CBS 101740]|uniref:Uncharacterized protein n=1 Tax=Aspergillus brasiliensis (strain CBS 101740 / IMI 381727 / IBT 21946) TaxID=767769 RepID=A0A1L9V135_ASPBC|nr:hypothetical protein ASPBRDRAFT_655064 [Aspergillus brasiliensis CBS 101740]
MAHNPPNGNQPQQKVSAKRVKREPKSQQTNPQPQASQSARQTKAFRLKGGMAKTKTAGARRHRPLFSEQYWDNQPKIHLTHSALMEFRRREAKIRWGGDRDKTPDLITTCKSVKEFAKRGGPDLTHLCDYQHPDTRDRRFRIPRLSMPAIYDMNLEGYLEHNGVEKRLGMALEPSNVAELRRIMREDRSDLSDFNVGARLSLAHLCTQYKTDSNALRGIYLNLFGRIGIRTENYRGTPLEGTITATKKHFYNLDPIVPHMISAKPDLVDGADRRDLMTEEERVEEEKKEEGKGKEKEEKEDGDEGQRKTGIGQGKEKKEEKGKGKEGKDGEVAKGDEGKKPTILTLLDRYITPYHLLDDVQVDEEDPNKMILPNFFLYNILKHDDQLAGGRAALHSGALGARALHELEHYGKDHVEFDGQAHTFAAVLATTHMTIYAFHPMQPKEEGRKIDYQMTAIKAFRFDDDTLDEDALTERVKDGIKALRNLREEAHRYRQKLIDDLFGVGSDDDDEDDEDEEDDDDDDDNDENEENEEDQEDDEGDGEDGDEDDDNEYDDNEDDDNDGGDDNNDNPNDADDEGDENDGDEDDNSQENSNDDGNYDAIDNDQDKENGDDGDDGRNNSSKEENSDNTDKKQTRNGSATKRKREPNPGVGFLESFIKRMRRS